MQVIVNTDNHISGNDALIAEIQAGLGQELERFAAEITRVEVHLADVNGPKGADDDKRCLMEARVAGRSPLAVSHQAATVGEAVDGASEKLARALESIFDKLNETKGRTSFGGDQVI